ncbi:nucleotidyl transferase AbiEii/AbiGii toxin family protein [Candidatus Gottesmanbacteria bacterium]|nr:nucleotidyl transferase AbiEii/AbiGii toxin family protein [Candidatus Gottesmanbacteria bacterium]
MGKTILTPNQYKFLELASADPKVVANFYLTGGTALSEFYLHHRLSEDLDLFCPTQEVDQRFVGRFIKKISSKLKIKYFRPTVFLGLVSYKLVFADKKELKVDFNYYPFPQIDKGVKFKNLKVDSLYDIATNKLHTLFMRPRPRDYIDLYFILRQENYSLERLIVDAKTKFDWHIDNITLASQFTRAKDLSLTELPKILVPFNQKDMEKFFLGLARSLKNKIFI